MNNDTKILTDFNKAFAKFKTYNDARINELAKYAGRPNSTGSHDSRASAHHYDGKEAEELRSVFEGKSMNSLAGSDGGYLVPRASATRSSR